MALLLCLFVLAWAAQAADICPGTVTSGTIVDISMPLSPKTPVWDSTTGMGEFLERRRSMEKGDPANSSWLRDKLPVHFGTHVDAPSHFVDGYTQRGLGVESLDLAVLNGPALLVEVPPGDNITASVLESLAIPPGITRILFKTDSSTMNLDTEPAFYSAYTALDMSGAQWMTENKPEIRLIGIDYLSVTAYEGITASHHHLLATEVIFVEGLVLKTLKPGLYDLHCLPVPYVNSDGAPCRCIVMT